MSDTITIGNFKINRTYAFVFIMFMCFLFVGLTTYKDYGLSWDENSQWKNNGHANYNFIFHGDKETLLNGIDKYHGPAFELILVFAEKTLSLTDSRDIYFLRHLITFLTFFISAIFFFLLSSQLFKSKIAPLITTLMYVLSPAIYAHSFYNSKDIGFLSFFVISVYLMLLFLKKPGYLNTLLFALFTAITIDIRIAGILIPLLILFIYLQNFALESLDKTKTNLNYKFLILYVLILCPLIVLFWPVLWLDPVHHFIEALKENSRYPWNGLVLYEGTYYTASDLPWHYLFFWLFISRPVIYSVLFITGIVVLFSSFVFRPIEFLREHANKQIITAWLILPVLAVFTFGSVVFDTGRHLYFIHGAFVLIAGYGAEYLLKHNILKTIVLILLLISFTKVIRDMIKIHPYEHLYFNECLNNESKRNFEFDYWGLSSRELLENILIKDTSNRIKIYAENYPSKLNVNILKESDRKRVIITDTSENADYYLADYRWKKAEEYIYQKDFYSVYVSGIKTATAFRIRDSLELFNTPGKDLYNNKNSFDAHTPGWTSASISSEKFRSGSGSLKVDSITEYSDNLVINDLTTIYRKPNLIVKTSFWCSSKNDNSASTKLVLSVETADGKSYIWRCLAETNQKAAAQWTNIKSAVELPEVYSPTDRIKVYFWNPNKATLFVEDFELTIVEEDSNEQ